MINRNIFSESQSDSITIQVKNVMATRDLIYSFYGIETNLVMPVWKYKLDLFWCRNFFGIDINLNDVNYIIVPVVGFDYLLDTIDMLGYNEDTIECLME